MRVKTSEFAKKKKKKTKSSKVHRKKRPGPEQNGKAPPDA